VSNNDDAHLSPTELYPEFKAKMNKFAREYINGLNAINFDLVYSDPDIGSPFNRSRLFRYYESLAMDNFTALEILNKYSVQADDLLERCNFNPINIRSYQQQTDKTSRPGTKDCTSTKALLGTIYEGSIL